jgi:hypothetical protein
MRGRRLEIDTQQLLLTANHPQLDGGADRRVEVQADIDATRRQQALQAPPCFVFADDRQQGNACAQTRRRCAPRWPRRPGALRCAQP